MNTHCLLPLYALTLVSTSVSARAVTTGAARPPLLVRLSCSSEGTYRDVVLSGSQLRYTYNLRNSLEKPDDIGSLMRQAPHWTQADLVTEQVTVPPSQVADMVREIQQTGFLKLKGVYGDRKGRAYGTTLHVIVGSGVKNVLYLSGPHGGPPPKAFSAVEARLVRLVNVNCKHKIS